MICQKSLAITIDPAGACIDWSTLPAASWDGGFPVEFGSGVASKGGSGATQTNSAASGAFGFAIGRTIASITHDCPFDCDYNLHVAYVVSGTDRTMSCEVRVDTVPVANGGTGNPTPFDLPFTVPAGNRTIDIQFDFDATNPPDNASVSTTWTMSTV